MMGDFMVEALKEVKKHEGELELLQGYVVTYDKEMEADGPSTHGPWSIEGRTENISTGNINALGAVLDAIREIEQNA